MSNSKETTQTFLNFSEVEKYLRKIKEWDNVFHLDRETIIKWAEFLKNKGAD